jgi:hypothetical protein
MLTRTVLELLTVGAIAGFILGMATAKRNIVIERPLSCVPGSVKEKAVLTLEDDGRLFCLVRPV